ncbi:MAG TPA: GIY-YIG nuclease family protein [Phototrophicaceae bacterium]|nr:GIY-YIG nuclease family protein [Phototrophicaceae bacterium]
MLPEKLIFWRCILNIGSNQNAMNQESLAGLGRGTYVLILHLNDDRQIQVGKLGLFAIAAGFYAYVGSAFGTGGLSGRLKHHLTPAAHPHWHVDYLRQVATLESIWYSAAAARHEHEWAAFLAAMPGMVVAVPRFGASDCSCSSHLFYSREVPAWAEFQMRAQRLTPGDTLARCRIAENE